MCTNRENIPSEIASLRKKIFTYEEKERSLLKIQPFISISQNLEKDELPKQHKMLSYANEELKQIQEKKKFLEIELNNLRESLRKANDNKVNFFLKLINFVIILILN